MQNERRNKLISTMKQFNKDQKEEVLFFGNEIEDQEVISTGIKSIDKFLGGGVKKGTHTILWGSFSAGKTSLALQIIGNAQKEGKICAYINLEKPVDNERFIAMGVDLKELVRSDCTKNAEQALTVIKKLCQAKVVDLIVVDSIQALSPKAENENKKKERQLDEKTIGELARTMSEFCRRVNPDIYRAKAGIVWIGQIRLNIGSFFAGATLTGGEAIKFYAYQIIFMRRGQSSDAPCKKFKNYWLDPDGKLHYTTVNEAIGFDAVLKMDKNNSAKAVKEKTEKHFPFIYEKGFVDTHDANQNIKIRVDPEAPEPEQEKIKEMMIEKAILKESCEKIAQKYEERDLDQTLKEEYSEIENKISEEALKSKKKRGRPKKEKK